MQELSAKNVYGPEKKVLVCKISDFVSLQFIQYYTIHYNTRVLKWHPQNPECVSQQELIS